MATCKSILSLTSGALLILSFIALLGFLKAFNSGWAIVWELFFAFVSICIVFCGCYSSSMKMFKLSLFYATNLVLLMIFGLHSKSAVSFAFFVIALILMSLGFVIAINSINVGRKPLVKKSIDELRQEVDDAFDNIAAADLKIEKYYHNKTEKKPESKKGKARKKSRK